MTNFEWVCRFQFLFAKLTRQRDLNFEKLASGVYKYFQEKENKFVNPENAARWYFINYVQNPHLDCQV